MATKTGYPPGTFAASADELNRALDDFAHAIGNSLYPAIRRAIEQLHDPHVTIAMGPNLRLTY